jgi:putative transposase
MSRVTHSGEATVVQLCTLFEVSRAAYYAARTADTSPKVVPLRPLRSGTVTAPALKVAIEGVVAKYPAWGHRKVWAVVRRQGLKVGRRRVYEMMRELNLLLPATHEGRVPRPRGHVATAEPNRRLATDLTTVWTRNDGLVAIALTVDCGCRSILDVTATKSQESPAVLGSVERSLERAFGCPADVPEGVELRSDHGPQYTGRDAEALARKWGLEQTFAPVGRPTGNAVAERTIQTMKLECIWLMDFDGVEDLQSALDAWQDTFNHERPHQSLDWQTPWERRCERLGIPYPERVAS